MKSYATKQKTKLKTVEEANRGTLKQLAKQTVVAQLTEYAGHDEERFESPLKFARQLTRKGQKKETTIKDNKREMG
jgi:hypothetical protein